MPIVKEMSSWTTRSFFMDFSKVVSICLMQSAKLVSVVEAKKKSNQKLQKTMVTEAT